MTVCPCGCRGSVRPGATFAHPWCWTKLQRRPHKYGATPTVVDGIRFASRKEAKRYAELKLLEKAGAIRNLTLQPSFRLCAWRPDHSECPIIGVYRGDFQYEELTETGGRWDMTVEDVKGFKTPLYRWKKKHVEAQYGIQVKEI